MQNLSFQLAQMFSEKCYWIWLENTEHAEFIFPVIFLYAVSVRSFCNIVFILKNILLLLSLQYSV